MLPSAHILPAIAVAIKTRPETSWIWFPIMVILAHVPFDLIPHLEPGLFSGSEYTSPYTFNFWWAQTDIAISFLLCHKLTKNQPEYRRVVWLIFIAGIGPDLVQAWTQIDYLPQSQWLKDYENFHHQLHNWWKRDWPKQWSITIGTIDTLLLWWFAWKFRPRSKMVVRVAPIKVPEMSL
ncbi:MAG: hypothetical protein CEO12_52 [Parcubacteria group bacterium Gr01-1014_46]|nr:MAG: hypothetical protein CEO12_52 [Parcubacteria group bacterium Gr01-1014_46]